MIFELPPAPRRARRFRPTSVAWLSALLFAALLVPVISAGPASAGPIDDYYPNASNTGVRPGTQLSARGALNVTQNGAVYENLDINGCVTIRANNVTIRNSRIRGACYPNAVNIDGGASGILLEDVEIDGGGNPMDAALLGNSGYTCRRCNIHGGASGIRMNNNVVVEDSWVHDLSCANCGHNTAIGSNGGNNFTLRHNRFENNVGGSSTFSLYGDFAQIRDVLAEDNLFDGGGSYAVYGGSVAGKPWSTAQNVRFINNRWGRTFNQNGGYYGPVGAFSINDPGNAWTGNAFTDGRIINWNGGTGGTTTPLPDGTGGTGGTGGTPPPPGGGGGGAFALLRNQLSGGNPDARVDFASNGTDIVAGDWNGDGKTDLAQRTANRFDLVRASGGDLGLIGYGRPGDEVFVGDWDCDGDDTFAVRRGNVFYVKYTTTSGPADRIIGYGKPTDDVYVGDWNGNGCDSFAVRRGNVFYARNTITTGIADIVFGYGRAGDEVMVGDWNADGRDGFAVRRASTMFLTNRLRSGPAESTFSWGRASDVVVVGDWDGNGSDTFGLVRSS